MVVLTLTFADGSVYIGYDTSGNGNDWTTNDLFNGYHGLTTQKRFCTR